MRKYIVVLFIMILLEMVLYAPLISTFFDPQEFISVLNPLENRVSIGKYMIDSWSWTQNNHRIGFFRPVTSFSFIAEFPLWGADPAGYRVMNLFFHLCVCLLTIPLGKRIGIVKFWWLPAVLTIIHPGALDAVWLIVARHDVLAVLFSLTALILTFDLLKGRLRGIQGILPWIAAVFALGSKELGIANILALPLLVLAWPGAHPEKKSLKFFWMSAPVVLLLFVGSRLLVFGNIGGYGGYTHLSQLPSRIYTMLIQSISTFYIQSAGLRILMYSVLALLAVSLLAKWRTQGRKIILLTMLYFLYGFQSIIGESCMHYVYVIMIFSSLITTYAIESGSFLSARGDIRRLLISGIIAILTFTAAFYWSSVLRSANTSKQVAFESVSAHADQIANHDRVAILLDQRGVPEVDELKNIELYLGYLKPGNNITFRFVADESELDPGEAFIQWADGDLLVGTCP